MRKSKRIDFGITAFDRKNKEVIGFITSLSGSGCFIETKKVIPINAAIDIEFELPDSLKVITTRSIVVRIEKNGIGVQFTLDAIQMKLVRQFVNDFSKR